MKHRVDVRVDYDFWCDLTTPAAGTGVVGPPAALGQVTGVVVRLSATKTGAAIHGDVGNLAATERNDMPGRFYYTVDTALLVTHLLPLGVGATFYAIWSKANAMDRQAVPYLVADGTV